MPVAKIVVTMALMLLIVPSSNCQSPAGRGPLIERWEIENNGLRVRITEYREKRPTFFYEFYYVFESMPAGANEWSEVMTVKFPDDIPLPKDQVRFVNDKTAYAFM